MKCSKHGDYGLSCFTDELSDGCYYWNGLEYYAEGKDPWNLKKCFIEETKRKDGKFSTYSITKHYCCTKDKQTLYIDYEPGHTFKCQHKKGGSVNGKGERWNSAVLTTKRKDKATNRTYNSTDKYSVQCPEDVVAYCTPKPKTLAEKIMDIDKL